MNPNYTVRDVKTFQGREGLGYSCILLCEGRKVAVVTDTASGGPVNFYWADSGAERVTIETVDHEGHIHGYRGTPEERIFVEYLNGRTCICPITGDELPMEGGTFVEDLVNQEIG